jgi:hypothetical protein
VRGRIAGKFNGRPWGRVDFRPRPPVGPLAHLRFRPRSTVDRGQFAQNGPTARVDPYLGVEIRPPPLRSTVASGPFWANWPRSTVDRGRKRTAPHGLTGGLGRKSTRPPGPTVPLRSTVGVTRRSTPAPNLSAGPARTTPNGSPGAPAAAQGALTISCPGQTGGVGGRRPAFRTPARYARVAPWSEDIWVQF